LRIVVRFTGASSFSGRRG